MLARIDKDRGCESTLDHRERIDYERYRERVSVGISGKGDIALGGE
jgi:hypothetical protein